MKKTTLIIALCLGILFLHSQTYFQGGIYENTIWSFNNSPYIITGDVAIFPEITLTIEPGVEVRFDGYYSIEVRGMINSIGTIDNKIVFTSNKANPDMNDWNEIKFNNSTNTQATFEYCNFFYGHWVCTIMPTGDDGSMSFTNCKFENNETGIAGYSSYGIEITSCEFNYNKWGVSMADKTITNSIFYRNEYGIHSGERIDVRNSTFQENEVAIYGGDGLIDSCIIENNDIGFTPINQGFELRENDIINNNIGVQVKSYNGVDPILNNNRICNNSLYNVENLDEINKDLRENCWCISDSTAIEEKIYDGYDNINLGLFNYDIYNDSCDLVLESVIKFSPVGTHATISFNDISMFPNPISNNLNIILPPTNTNNYNFTIYNNYWQEIVQMNLESNNMILNLDQLHPGIYYCVLKSGTDIIETRKLIKR